MTAIVEDRVGSLMGKAYLRKIHHVGTSMIFSEVQAEPTLTVVQV